MTETKPTYERVTCEDVELCDRIARTRTAEPMKVTSIGEGSLTRTFELHTADGRRYGGRIRPRRDAKLWRLVEEAGE